jgi:hypothetical protein
MYNFHILIFWVMTPCSLVDRYKCSAEGNVFPKPLVPTHQTARCNNQEDHKCVILTSIIQEWGKVWNNVKMHFTLFFSIMCCQTYACLCKKIHLLFALNIPKREYYKSRTVSRIFKIKVHKTN